MHVKLHMCWIFQFFGVNESECWMWSFYIFFTLNFHICAQITYFTYVFFIQGYLYTYMNFHMCNVFTCAYAKNSYIHTRGIIRGNVWKEVQTSLAFSVERPLFNRILFNLTRSHLMKYGIIISGWLLLLAVVDVSRSFVCSHSKYCIVQTKLMYMKNQVI